MKRMFLVAFMLLCGTSVGFGYDIPQSLIDCKAKCMDERECNYQISLEGMTRCRHSCDLYCTGPKPFVPTPPHITPSPIPKPIHPVPMNPSNVN